MEIHTARNPADYLSHGATLVELSQLTAWWGGPAFLSRSETDWPQLEAIDTPEDGVKELKKGYF